MSLLRLGTSALALAFSLTLAAPVAAEGLAGSYLAARQASIQSDYREAARYYAQALARDPSNLSILENAISAFVNLGQHERAVPIAKQMHGLAADSQIANLVLMIDDLAAERYDQLLDGIVTEKPVMPLVNGLAQAWGELGRGQVDAAIAAFDEIVKEDGLAAFGLYHKALALASVGDFEAADEIFAGEETPLRLDRRGIEARLQILSQLDRNADALELIEKAYGDAADPGMEALKRKFEAGAPVPFTAVQSAGEGMAEVFYMVASILSSEANPGYSLLFSRAAEALNPTHVDAILLSAELLDELEQYDLATEAYDRVPREHPSYYSAELGRADALRRGGKADLAIEVLEQLTESHADLPVVHNALGDMLRQEEDYEGAAKAYDAAIALFDNPEDISWRLFYVRGIARERIDRWDEAEADFRQSLKLRPDEPRVLNYLGYSLLEKQIKLDEALEMIEKAVEGSPDSGYIIDSLAWALYRLGRYGEAVPHIERAVALMPLDPVVNDHVGDIYWAVGRKREAEFQWSRALSFEPEEDEAERIRRKLEVGLDQVLEEEGAEPLAVANEG